jgi:hypothetical protein
MVMGRGVALQAKLRFPGIANRLAQRVKEFGNICCVLPDLRLVTLPTKRHWREDSDLRLIVDSVASLGILLRHIDIARIYVPRPGCGNGGLQWNDVRQYLLSQTSISDRIIFIDNQEMRP